MILDATLDPLPLVRNAHLGLLWRDYFREEYPSLEEHEPLSEVPETFDRGNENVFKFQLMGAPPVVRQWYVSSDRTRLVQVQPDRIIHNWRRPNREVAYPRYEALRECFQRHFASYVEFLAVEDLGIPTIRQAEVTYINQLQPDDVWSEPNQLDRVLRVWRPDFGEEGLIVDPLEEVRIAWSHVISEGARAYARMHVALDPTQEGGLLLRLTVRGKPRGGDLESALKFFDMGRERIVKGFAAITTPEMHSRWGRRNT